MIPMAEILRGLASPGDVTFPSATFLFAFLLSSILSFSVHLSCSRMVITCIERVAWKWRGKSWKAHGSIGASESFSRNEKSSFLVFFFLYTVILDFCSVEYFSVRQARNDITREREGESANNIFLPRVCRRGHLRWHLTGEIGLRRQVCRIWTASTFARPRE